ncbi:MAG: hypothetical protein AVDCRST_MAG66-4869 [uncultured Pseudonocardia sp.]|uniref:Uncharacterized protein n=1 Tax=uncultured Pseudonocardia sp. TaxID=211455 RepID=A0A6J4QLK4_9PSEU|nr:MAG: hypothetical protein AVDCRST_MAG66-4869 [uncultured Pseudonocardia sp.]
MPETIKLTPEDVAEHLRWRLSNANAEFEQYNAAFSTSVEGATLVLRVDLFDPLAHRRGAQVFTLTVS